MERCISAISKRTKDMEMDCLNGRMAESTMESGLEANSMASVFTEITREKKGKENGSMAKEFNG